MIFHSCFSVKEIDCLTYKEAEKYCDFFKKEEEEKKSNFLKTFAVYNFDTAVLADRGKEHQIKRYFERLREQEDPITDIDDQFNGVNFVEQN